MVVRYNVATPIVTLVVGTLSLALGCLRFAQGGFSTWIVLGPVLILAAGVQFARPYFTYDPDTRMIVIRSWGGPFTRRYGGAGGGTLDVVGDRFVCVRDDGSGRSLPLRRRVARSDDWDAVMATFNEQNANTPASLPADRRRG